MKNEKARTAIPAFSHCNIWYELKNGETQKCLRYLQKLKIKYNLL